MKQNKPNYGIDAPIVIALLCVFGILIPLGYWGLFSYFAYRYENLDFLRFGYMAGILTGLFFGLIAGLMLWTSKIGKVAQVRKVLDMISWQGTEFVLDAGTGRGLYANKIAKHYCPKGKVVGVDIWNKSDLSGNSLENAQNNAQLEGLKVAENVLFETADIRDLDYDDNMFDVVVSSLVIHNIVDYEERMQALSELMRVLKPGGYLVIQDIFKTVEYFEFFARSEYVREVELSGFQWRMFPPTRVLIVRK